MPARRSLTKFVVVDDGSRADRDARLAGVGLDWDDAPDLSGLALAEWQRLGGVFELSPTRFREGDRQALITYCRLLARLESVERELDRDGLMIAGRGHEDRGRLVKHPLLSVHNQLQASLRQWAMQLGLTPDSRGRANLDKDEGSDDSNNPFA